MKIRYGRLRHSLIALRDDPGGAGSTADQPGSGSTEPASTPAGETAPKPFDPADLSPEARAYLAKEISDREAKSRTTAKANAAAEATASVKAEIAKALGLTPEQVSPDKLAADLERARGEARTARVESAVERAARRAGADEDLVAAVLARSGKLGGLDPVSETFSTDVDALVAAAVEANPRLKLTPEVAVKPGGQGPAASAMSGGPGDGKQRKGLAGAIAGAYTLK